MNKNRITSAIVSCYLLREGGKYETGLGMERPIGEAS